MRSTPVSSAVSSQGDRAGAFLTVDLAAIAENWRLLKRQVGPNCEMGAVVKADAYGTGVESVGKALRDAGCKTFFVAHVDEGITLRAAIGDAPRIVVMHGPNKGTERDFAAFGLVPVLNSPAQIERWRGFARTNDVLMESLVHIDTGMNRLGLTAREFERLMGDADGFVGLHPLALMSHLACAEDNTPMNDAQRRKFASALETFRGKFPDAKGSFTNSSGIFLGPAYHFHVARPGVALYGANPLSGKPNPMIPVVRLKGKIVQVRRVDAAAPVGYGATYTAQDGAKLATVSIGYADGLLRSFSPRGHGYIDDIKVPVAGRVSMDLTIFDVSAVPDSSLGPDATIELIGGRVSVDEIAAEAGTISYEILTSLGARYARQYVK
ncbi:MAG: alanine racemase [Rhodospirillaceae bacterium]|nr:alanine racemase [Rhodospirillaceae bacterium]